jgi:FdrA protein
MQFSRALKQRPGVSEASAVMATEANLALLRESGLLNQALEPRPDDLLLVLSGQGISEDDLDAAEAALRKPAGAVTAESGTQAPGSSLEAVGRDGRLNFALISVPGDYAAAEALKALASGLHVMLFSDNVSVDREVFLKDEAQRRGLLLVGPDCGTALMNGVPLGFANVVRRGPVGVVSASGTGLQEVTSLLHRWGSGVSQALGTGGRDLKDAVGARATLACLDLLEADPNTRLVLLVSKPPGDAVRLLLEQRLARFTKPVVTCFVGDRGSPSLAEAARQAFIAAEGREPRGDESALPGNPRLRSAGKWLRGLYSGGTLCAEAAFRAAQVLGAVTSNVSVPGVQALDDPWTSVGHTLVDLGDDEFTRGRPHPMIDQGLRLERLAKEAADPETAVILADVVLGFGAHPDPAGELAAFVGALDQRPDGSRVPVVVSVTGTDDDPQGWSRSLGLLRLSGAAAYGSHIEAVEAALAIVLAKEPS